MKYALLLLCLMLGSLAHGQETVRLTILHTNDVHGHLRPLSLPAVPSNRRPNALSGALQGGSVHAQFELPERRDLGGIARRTTLVSQIRKEKAPVWLIDAGDFFHYSPFSQEYHGLADVQAMNAAGYDFGGLGNHEFEITGDQLRAVVKAARFTFLCANIHDSKTSAPLARPYEVRTVGGVRIGVFGLVTDVSRSRAVRDGLIYQDYTEAAKATVALLREREKVDAVVLISHLGEFADKPLAAAVPGIDVIVGGHSHTRLPQGELVPWSSEPHLEAVNGTVLVQTGQWGTELGRLDLLFAKGTSGKWRLARYQASLLPITKAIPEAAAVNAVLERLWAPLAATYDTVIATATEDFADRGDDLAQNHLYADAVRSVLGTELELDRLGGTFWPLLAGPITRASLIDLDQSTSTVVTFKIKGSDLRRMLELSTPMVSGVRYRVNRGKLEFAEVNDQPLDSERVYTVAANSASLSRLEGIPLIERTDTGRAWSAVVREGIAKLKTLTPRYDSRRVVITAPYQPRDRD